MVKEAGKLIFNSSVHFLIYLYVKCISAVQELHSRVLANKSTLCKENGVCPNQNALIDMRQDTEGRME